jgi:hypothetical protein
MLHDISFGVAERRARAAPHCGPDDDAAFVIHTDGYPVAVVIDAPQP